MRALVRERELAIVMRKRGNSYKEILVRIPVAKSTLSSWLIDLPLTHSEKIVMKRRLDSNISKGRIRAAASLRAIRLERERILQHQAAAEFTEFSKDPLFQLGLALYWAEGSKRDSGFAFANSDDEMINIMLVWIEHFFKVKRETIKVRLYIHKPYAHENCERYWSTKIRISINNFQRTIYKPTGLLVKKRPNYKGCLRINLGKMEFLRKMLYWQNMLIEEYRKR